MKISEVIKNLEKYMESFGDQDIFINDRGSALEVKDIYREEDKVKIYT